MTKTFSLQQLQFIIDHHEDMTVRELADHLGMKPAVIASIGYRNHIPFKKHNRRIKESPAFRRGPYFKIPVGLRAVIREPLIRPAAMYDNTGYLDTLKKYGA